jgi:adenine-specific DNA-methyltransferase
MAITGRKPRTATATAIAGANGGDAKSYGHPDAKAVMRPDIGTQAQFKKKKEPKRYRYDSSLSPVLEWDGQNAAREQGEALIREILEATSLEQAKAAADKLRKRSKPFLNWAGKAERLSFDVPTLPMFVHERLSTKAILETLRGHTRDKQISMFDLFADPGHSITDQVLKAYEHQDRWVNRMILGDSVVVMNSLLQYEGLGGKVQMIYMDPPYGVKFGSNFQPFVRNRSVNHGDDEDMTREPEMVQAYRDTWELGLHSYLTYMRDRLSLCRDLLTPTGSLFVQISEENLHHVMELMDEVLGSYNRCSIITFVKTSGLGTKLLPRQTDHILWYAKDISVVKYHQLFLTKSFDAGGADAYGNVELSTGETRRITTEERADLSLLPKGSRLYRLGDLTKPGPGSRYVVKFGGREFTPGNRWWGIPEQSMARLLATGRVVIQGSSLSYKRYLDDFPAYPITNLWDDTGTGSGLNKLYVVQTNPKVVEHCMLMTTDPGDLVVDPTCGSGTTAFVAEQWGRRWITTDVSRVPVALARQRLLTATYAWYDLKDENRGPAGGFVYQRRHNNNGEEVGGVVPHVTLKSIANNEPPDEEILVDRPESKSGVTRVTGPFCVESTIPAPGALEPDESSNGDHESGEPFVNRMLEVLRKSPVLRLPENKTANFKNIRPPAKTLTLSAEGVLVNGQDKLVAFVFGPENGAVSEKLVYESAREAHMKNYEHLFVIGFAVEAKARTLIENCQEVSGVPATYVQATTDLTMSDLLKTMRSSQIFSVCGLPDVKLRSKKDNDGSAIYQVELLGLDVFDPVTMESIHYKGDEAAEKDKVPAWLLDTDFNNLCFHVSQAFFPRTAAWDSLKRALKGTYEESVWDHLAGTRSEWFEGGDHKQIAVKVIDDRGNELLVVKNLSEAETVGERA